MIVKARGKGQTELTACAYCGVLRRKAMNLGARQVGANKVATAHTLDDEAQTVLMNIFHGDILRLAKEKPVTSQVDSLLVQKIKPFCEIPENESALYAYVKKIRFQDTPCPYAGEALRNDVRWMLNRMEAKHAGTKFTVLRAAEQLKTCSWKKLRQKKDLGPVLSAVNLHQQIYASPVKCCGTDTLGLGSEASSLFSFRSMFELRNCCLLGDFLRMR